MKIVAALLVCLPLVASGQTPQAPSAWPPPIKWVDKLPIGGINVRVGDSTVAAIAPLKALYTVAYHDFGGTSSSWFITHTVKDERYPGGEFEEVLGSVLVFEGRVKNITARFSTYDSRSGRRDNFVPAVDAAVKLIKELAVASRSFDCKAEERVAVGSLIPTEVVWGGFALKCANVELLVQVPGMMPSKGDADRYFRDGSVELNVNGVLWPLGTSRKP